MAVNVAAGTRIFIGSSTTDRNQSQADYEADSYIEIGEIEDGGEFGDQSEDVTFASLADSRTRHFKGTRDAGTQTLVVGDDPSDEGQLALEAAEASHLDFNFKVQLNDAISLGGEGSIHYFIGKVMSKRRNLGNVNNVVRRTFAVGINSATVDVDPT